MSQTELSPSAKQVLESAGLFVETKGSRIIIGFGEHSQSCSRHKGSSLLSFPTDYVVVDLETTGLDPSFDEIIEVAAVRVSGDEIVGEYTSLVKPEQELDPYITELTGITPEMLETAPSLSDVLPAFLDFIKDAIVVGHNVNFDINFIYDASMRLLKSPFKNDFVDTMRISRNLFPDEKHHRLCDLIARFGIDTQVAHRAMADVLQTNACLQYMKAYAETNGLVLTGGKHVTRAKNITTDVTDFNEDSPIFGKLFVFTGTLSKFTRAEAMQAVVDRGGQCADTVKKATDFLVIGGFEYCTTLKDGKSSKRKKAEMMKLDGSGIEIISENTFIDMLSFE